MNRPEMKQHAKALVARNRARAVLALLIPMVVYIVLYGLPLVGFIVTENPPFLYAAIAVALLYIPMTVGFAHFFIRFEKDPDTPYDAVLKGYKDGNFFRSLGRLLQMIIFIYVWMLFLVVPGVIKALAYAMTPFILADDDFKDSNEDPITISRKMMNGYKAELFVLFLSFIGWMILGALTLHILTVLYVLPYFYQTLALFYKKVKEDYNERKSLTQNSA
ncbi:MAG: DUF975 family protein [Bacillota bacterium]